MATEDIQPVVENNKKSITKTGDEFSALKRPSDNSSDYQPETKKQAIGTENIDNRNAQAAAVARMSNGGQVTEYMMVPDKMVGLLIGKGGEQITAIQNDCQCRVQFAPETGAPTRQCTLTGPPPNVMRARKTMDELILKNQFISLGGDEVALEMMLPGGKVGLVIGKSGDTIKQLQERSGAKVAVIQDSTVITDFDKPLRISGTKQNCQRARELVLELLNDAGEKSSMRSAPGNGLGGGGLGGGGGGGGGPPFQQGNMAGKHSVEIPVPRGLVGIVIGKGGEMIKKVQEESGAKVQFRPDDIVESGPNRMCHVYGFKNNNDVALSIIHDLIKTGLSRQNGGGGGGFGGGGGGGGGGGFGGFQGGNNGNGVIHLIPTDKCGLIIGKGGENIKEMNRVTGAHAELVRDAINHNDPSTKPFKIQGTPEQVQHCISLINEKAGLPPVMGGGVQGGMYAGMQAPMQPSPFAPLNMQQGGGMMSAYQQPGTQVLVPSQQVFTSHLPQQGGHFASPASNFPHQPVQVAQVAAYAPQTNPLPTTALYLDPAKTAGATAGSGDASTWAAYLNQQAYPGGQQQQQAQQQQQGVSSLQQQPSMAYAAPSQIINPAPQQQPQPTINPQTGQADYSLAWAEYYRAQGLHQQAAAVMQAAGMPSQAANPANP